MISSRMSEIRARWLDKEWARPMDAFEFDVFKSDLRFLSDQLESANGDGARLRTALEECVERLEEIGKLTGVSADQAVARGKEALT